MTETLTRTLDPEPCPDALEDTFTCLQVLDITHDVKTFVLAPTQGRIPAFQPGQYLTLTVDVAGQRLQRCYTISSPPTRPGPPEITVKRVPGGPVSNWLHDHLVPGGTVGATGPYGEFSTARYPASKYLFLSAGSGITPLMSMTRALYDAGVTDVVFVHSARTPDDIIFRRELAAIAVRGDIATTMICEGDSPSEQWSGTAGRLGLRTLLRAAPDLHDREVFTCGPPGYMAAVTEMLSQAGVDPRHCHEENFDLAARAAARADPAEPVDFSTQPRYTVEFRRTGRRIDCAGNETVLHAARRAGLNPPCMCTEGMCGTCKTTLLDGSVDMQHQGGIRQREIDAGEILVCCSTPRGDLAVDA